MLRLRGRLNVRCAVECARCGLAAMIAALFIVQWLPVAVGAVKLYHAKLPVNMQCFYTVLNQPLVIYGLQGRAALG